MRLLSKNWYKSAFSHKRLCVKIRLEPLHLASTWALRNQVDLRETVKLSNIAIKSVLKRQSNKSSSGGFSDLPQRSIGFFFSRQKRRVHLSCVNEFCRQMCKWKEWINGGRFGRKLNQRKLIYPYKSLLWNMTALSLRRVISLCGTIFFVQRTIFVFTFGLFG